MIAQNHRNFVRTKIYHIDDLDKTPPSIFVVVTRWANVCVCRTRLLQINAMFSMLRSRPTHRAYMYKYICISLYARDKPVMSIYSALLQHQPHHSLQHRVRESMLLLWRPLCRQRQRRRRTTSSRRRVRFKIRSRSRSHVILARWLQVFGYIKSLCSVFLRQSVRVIAVFSALISSNN